MILSILNNISCVKRYIYKIDLGLVKYTTMNPAKQYKFESFTDAQLSSSLFSMSKSNTVPATAVPTAVPTDNDAEELKARLLLNTTKSSEDKK